MPIHSVGRLFLVVICIYVSSWVIDNTLLSGIALCDHCSIMYMCMCDAQNERRFSSQLFDLRDRLEQSHSTNRSLQSYVEFLKNSYTAVFSDTISGLPTTTANHRWTMPIVIDDILCLSVHTSCWLACSALIWLRRWIDVNVLEHLCYSEAFS